MAFSSALSSGAISLSNNRQYLLNTVFPAELLPVRSLLVASASLPVGIGLVFVADMIFSTPSWTLLLVPVVLLAQVLFTCGIVWVLSLLTLVIHDIQHGLQYVTIVLLIITPIGYTPDMIPSNFKILMYGNPLFYFVTSYQNLIIFHQLPPLYVVITGLLMNLAVFLSGYWIFQHAKMTFYEYA
jgi:lipopolysaccharide transport system permease protein